MSGTRITDQQVRLYMNKRKHHPQEVAAAKTGISVRTARRIERDATLPSQKPRHSWRTRPDPFVDVWDSEVVPLLRNAPHLMGITVLRKLQDDHPDRYPDSMRRTLERRIRQWRALEGPTQEVFFPQAHQPGVRGLSDFTDMSKLCVTIGGAPFGHRLYHFVLAFSRWEYANVVEGGESFEALATGLQNALWQAGGCPREHRSDSLSAAFKNLQEQEDFTTRYAALLDHYGMEGTRNNRGLGHENGSVESSHRYLKEAVDQALMLRGHRDFADRPAYDEFVREVVMRRNRRNAAAFRIEREQLQDLPERRTTDFAEEEALVTRCSTFTVRGILYSAPSRLIGHRLKVRVYGDRLDCYLSGALVHSTVRGSRAADNRHALDYRHFIDSLRRKPQAFKGLAFRDALFPREAYRRTWERLEEQLTQRQACKTMVGLLELAGHHGVEALLAERLDALLAAGELPDLKQLRDEFAPRQALCPEVVVEMPPVSVYDELLETPAHDSGRLALMLNELRLPTIGRLWPEFAERSDKEGWQASRLLGALLEHELAERAKRRIERHRTESHLDPTKTLATFDFGMVPMVSKAHVTALATGESWLEKGATILLFGPPGGGKSHLGSAIGHALIDAGYRVLFTRTAELVQKLQAARQSLQLPSALAKLDRFDLIILDDLSYARKDQAETSVLFELIAERYERKSLLITANQPFSGWNDVFPDPGMTVAAIDRLVHHSTIFELNVESYRRRKASDKQNARRRQLPDDNSSAFSGQVPDDDNVTQ